MKLGRAKPGGSEGGTVVEPLNQETENVAEMPAMLVKILLRDGSRKHARAVVVQVVLEAVVRGPAAATSWVMHAATRLWAKRPHFICSNPSSERRLLFPRASRGSSYTCLCRPWRSRMAGLAYPHAPQAIGAVQAGGPRTSRAAEEQLSASVAEARLGKWSKSSQGISHRLCQRSPSVVLEVASMMLVQGRWQLSC